MHEKEFEYGPVARGAYIALIAVLPVLPLVRPGIVLEYLCFLIFLGFGLRPLLQYTGLYQLFHLGGGKLRDRADRKFLQQRRMEIDRKARDEKYRKSHYRDPKLPKRW